VTRRVVYCHSIHCSHSATVDGTVFYEHACKIGAEGMVPKRRGSRHLAGRTGQWGKVKNPAALAATRELAEERERDDAFRTRPT